ncbi:MAG TPA: hypothetical protein VF290_19700 [Pyrinomonadaceae bacterium]
MIAICDFLKRLIIVAGIADAVTLKQNVSSSEDMKQEPESQSPIACDMSALSLDQRERHIATSRQLFSNVQAIHELSSGYEFRLADDLSAIVSAAEFISVEKLCCPFLHFALEVNAESGPVFLRLTGREGVKDFIREEISGLLGNAIDWR